MFICFGKIFFVMHIISLITCGNIWGMLPKTVTEIVIPHNVDDKEANYNLIIAVMGGKIKIAKKLLFDGACAGVRSNIKYSDDTMLICTTPLHQAVYANNKEMLQLLLAFTSGTHAINQTSNVYLNDYKEKKESITPLHCAVQSGKPELVALLCEAGADVNALYNHKYENKKKSIVSVKKQTALHDAVEKENLEIINILLTYGALPTFKNSLDKSPLDLAEKKSKTSLLYLVLSAAACKPSYADLYPDFNNNIA